MPTDGAPVGLCQYSIGTAVLTDGAPVGLDGGRCVLQLHVLVANQGPR